MLTVTEIRSYIDETKNDPFFKELYPRSVLVEIYQSFSRELQRELSWERLNDSLALAYFAIENKTFASSWTDMIWYQIWESSTRFIKLFGNRLVSYKRKLAGITELFWKGDQLRRNHLYKRGHKPDLMFDLVKVFEREDEERLEKQIGKQLRRDAKETLFDNGFNIDLYNWRAPEEDQSEEAYYDVRNIADREISLLIAASHLTNTGELTGDLLEIALEKLKQWGAKREAVKGAFDWMLDNLSKVHKILPGWSLPDCFAEVLSAFKVTMLEIHPAYEESPYDW